MPKGEDFDFTFRMAAALHAIILSKGMTADNMNPGWDTEDAIEHAGNAEWGYSCCNIPEITTTMRHGAVFFSNNRNLTLMNTDVRRIVAMIKPFSNAKNLKIATALYQLTIHSEDAYTTVAQISDKSGVSPEQVQDCLESDLSQFILEKEGPESQFRFEGMYMNILDVFDIPRGDVFYLRQLGATAKHTAHIRDHSGIEVGKIDGRQFLKIIKRVKAIRISVNFPT